MPKNKIENIIRIIIFIMQEKGGVRKTTSAELIFEYFRSKGFSPKIVQVDNQYKLLKYFGNAVYTCDLPNSLALHQDDMADARALEPLLKTIIHDKPEISIIDVGANRDEKVLDYLLSSGIVDDIEYDNAKIYVFVPFLPDSDTVVLGVKSIRRASVALKTATIVPILCDRDNYPLEQLNAGAQEAYKNYIQPVIDDRGCIHLARLPQGAVSLVENAQLTYAKISTMSRDELDEKFPESKGPAAVTRGEIRSMLVRFYSDLVD